VLGTGASRGSTQNKRAGAEVQLADLKGTIFEIKCIETVLIALIYLNLNNHSRRKFR
jgi:hypothetical protein